MSPVGSMGCFILRPMGKQQQNAWELAIRPAVEAVGLTAWDTQDPRWGSGLIHKDITKYIWESQLVIADLTGGNPNVMYELGLAHAAKKPTILIVDQEEEPPFDVRHLWYLKYDPQQLSKLKADLATHLTEIMARPLIKQPDLFPELAVVTPELQDELQHYRVRAARLRVTVTPPCADVFFNDRLVGTGDQTILVNPDAGRSTISAVSAGFFEYHAEITPQNLLDRVLTIELNRPGSNFSEQLAQRVPAWLRDRRRDPHNPVLMRAICRYLYTIGETDDAFEEARQLLDVAPGWYLAINEIGYYYGDKKADFDRAITYYRQVAAMKPDHFVGNFNLACVYSLQGEVTRSIEHLAEILRNPDSAASIRYTYHRLGHDPDLLAVAQHESTAAPFREIELALFPDSLAHADEPADPQSSAF